MDTTPLHHPVVSRRVSVSKHQGHSAKSGHSQNDRCRRIVFSTSTFFFCKPRFLHLDALALEALLWDSHVQCLITDLLTCGVHIKGNHDCLGSSSPAGWQGGAGAEVLDRNLPRAFKFSTEHHYNNQLPTNHNVMTMPFLFYFFHCCSFELALSGLSLSNLTPYPCSTVCLT